MITKSKQENQVNPASDSSESIVYRTHIDGGKRRQLFNENWKFIYGDQSNAHVNAYDDQKWEDIQLPHDYSLTLPYTPTGEAESGYKLGGIGWYRKAFTLDESVKDKRVMIEFGGIYMNATIFINGHKLGMHPYGYTPFAYDLTEYLHEDKENVLSVQVNHKFPSSRWYSGSGIYRNVHLTITDKTYLDHYGIKVTTPNLAEQIGQEVDVNIQTKINNDKETDVSFQVRQSIRQKGSETILTSNQGESITLKAKASTLTDHSLSIQNPELWSISKPNLYEVITEVMIDGEVVDQRITDYGFRTINFDQETGFHLNGEPLKLKGVCIHHDQGALGSAAHERAIERQIEILQDMGANALRIAHNPAADELIDLANQKGMLVIDEAFDTWIKYKNGNSNDYAMWFREEIGDNPLVGAKPEMTWGEFDAKTMVRRGINAPSIIMWSVGNEVMEGNSSPYDEYPHVLKQLVEWVQEEDTTRPATTGENKLKGRWKEAIEMANVLAESGGIVGFNYTAGEDFDRYRKEFPHWKMYGAETASSINSRDVYEPNQYHNHLTSYDESVVGWGHLAAHSWYITITRDFNAGEFIWTGFDYLGEPTPWNNVGPGVTGDWPSPKSSYFGIVDTAGIPKDRYYFYQSQWNEDVNTLHILPTWKEDYLPIDQEGNVRVDVYSNAKAVELFFVDQTGIEKSLGKKTFTKKETKASHTYQIYEGHDKSEEDFRNLYMTWQVPYEDGTVYAKSYNEQGEEIPETVGRNKVATYKEPSRFNLAVDRQQIIADGQDLAYISIDVLDEDGNIVANADNLIHVDVSGEGILKALDNGDQTDHEPYDSGKRCAFNGKLVAIVQSTKQAGDIHVHVETEGIEKQTIKIETIAQHDQSDEKQLVGYTLNKNYYAKLGSKPELPKQTSLHFSDESREVHAIDWDLDEALLNQPGTFQVVGKIAASDVRIFAYVSVIESIGGILNYATTTETGVEEVALPVTRPLILANGDILQTEFDVKWEEQNKEDYEVAGMIDIQGVADVFGEKIPTLARIRVEEREVTYGENVASNNLTLREGQTKSNRAQDLAYLVDGLRDDPAAVWTNTAHDDNKSEIIFTYATAQFLGYLDVFYQENEDYSLPKAVELYWSNEGTEHAEWVKIKDIQSSEETTESGVKVNYRFPGVPAVSFKIVLISETSGKTGLIGINEMDLRIENNSLKVHETAKLDDILIDGKSVSTEELTNRVIYLSEQEVDIQAVSHKNVAVTVLEASENMIQLITESEDHLSRDKYTIHLK